MEEIEAYSFDIHIFKNEDNQYEYSVSQEFETDDDMNWELLESGEASTLEEAARTAAHSIRTLFTV